MIQYNHNTNQNASEYESEPETKQHTIHTNNTDNNNSNNDDNKTRITHNDTNKTDTNKNGSNSSGFVDIAIKLKEPGKSPIAAINEDRELNFDTKPKKMNKKIDEDPDIMDVVEQENIQALNSLLDYVDHSNHKPIYNFVTTNDTNNDNNHENSYTESMHSHVIYDEPRHGHGHTAHHSINFGLTQDWDTHEAKRLVGWFELFTDLIFVAVIIKMTKMYDKLWVNYTDERQIKMVIEIFIFHFAFFCVWLEMAVIQTRFKSRKPFFALMKYLYFAGVVTMAMQLDGKMSSKNDKYYSKSYKKYRPSSNALGFSWGLLICFITHMAIHFHLCTIPRATLYCLVNVCVILICVSVLSFGLLIESKDESVTIFFRMACIFIAILLLYMRTSTTFAVHPNQIPVNVHHFAERFGLLMMLYIGESIISELTADYKFEPKYYYLIHLGFLNVYIIRIIYYNLAHAESKHRGDTHALRNAGTPGSRSFVTAHIFLSFGLVGDAIGLKLMVKDLDKGNYFVKRDTLFFIYTHVFVQLCILFIRHTHQKVRQNFAAYLHLFLRGILTVILFPLIPSITKDILTIVTLMVSLTLFFAFFDVIWIEYIKKSATNADLSVFNYGDQMKTIRNEATNPESTKSGKSHTLRYFKKELKKRNSIRRRTQDMLKGNTIKLDGPNDTTQINNNNSDDNPPSIVPKNSDE